MYGKGLKQKYYTFKEMETLNKKKLHGMSSLLSVLYAHKCLLHVIGLVKGESTKNVPRL